MKKAFRFILCIAILFHAISPVFAHAEDAQTASVPFLHPIAAGSSAAAILQDGTLYMWGDGARAMFGDGIIAQESRPVPTPTPTGLTDVRSVATCRDKGFALTSDGTLFGWGNTTSSPGCSLLGEGYLGDYTYETSYGTRGYQTVPLELDKNVAAFAVGESSASDFLIVVYRDGSVASRGSNTYGQLGNGSYQHSSQNTEVLLDHCVDISAGGAHVLALKDDGTVYSWGLNSAGQLGNGKVTNGVSASDLHTVPTQVQGLADVVSVHATEQSSYAITSDGTLWGWGADITKHEGGGKPQVTPRKLMTDVKMIDTSYEIGYIVKTDGSLYRWHIEDWPIASSVKVMDHIAAISMRHDNTLALREDGVLLSWGQNQHGQLGSGEIETKKPNRVTEYNLAVEILRGVAIPGSDGAAIQNHTITSIDYLAFSQLSYFGWDFFAIDALKADTVGDILAEGETVTGSDIPYRKLCENILNWKPRMTSDVWGKASADGFYAVTFCDDAKKQAVIAFRGSASLDETTLGLGILNPDGDAASDWLGNDLPFHVFHSYAPQLKDALDYYDYCKALPALEGYEITVTGHSLGGALAETVSMTYGVFGEVFNAAAVFETLYLHDAKQMSAAFRGSDRWNFIAHVNEKDTAVALWQNEVLDLPHVVHQDTGVSGAHALVNMLLYDGDTLKLSPASDLAVSDGFSVTVQDKLGAVPLDIPEAELHFGSSGDDSLKHTGSVSGTLYGGDGDDFLISLGDTDDVLVGGRSETLDRLIGGWGDDTYLYHKGDGVQWIYDIGGWDTLKLIGFSEEDQFETEEMTIADTKYQLLTLTNSDGANVPIAYISLARTDDIWNNRFTVTKDEETLYDIAGQWRDFYSAAVSCPVDVDILDADGQIVLTLANGSEAFTQTSFGNFCVYTDSTGESRKYFDLQDGYTASIRGVGTGTMNVTVLYDGMSADQYSSAAIDIPVAVGVRASILCRENGMPLLQLQEGNTVTEYAMQIRKVVTLDYADGSGKTQTVLTDYDGTLRDLPAPMREGYLCEGWKTADGTVIVNGDRVQDNLTLTASWSVKPSTPAETPSEPPSSKPTGDADAPSTERFNGIRFGPIAGVLLSLCAAMAGVLFVIHKRKK